MTENQRLERGLPTKALRPALTRASQLISGIVSKSHWEILRNRGERVWLFDPPTRVLEHPAVKAYLELPKDQGGCKRSNHQIANRDPWYRTPLPLRIEGFISGMSRLGPWLVFKGLASLTASNTLYTFRFRHRLTLDEKSAWAISLLTKRVREQLQVVGRRYPDGLLKYEPSDLLKLEVARPRRLIGAQKYYLEVSHAFLTGNFKSSYSLVEEWMSGELSSKVYLSSKRKSKSA